MTSVYEAAKTATVKALESRIEQLPISDGVKALMKYVIEHADSLISFAYEYEKKHPGKPEANKMLREFLLSQGMSLASLGIQCIDDQTVKDVWAVITLLWDIKDAAKYTEIPVVGAVITSALVVSAGGNFLNDCRPTQVWYYEHMLKESSPKYLPTRVKSLLRRAWNAI